MRSAWPESETQSEVYDFIMENESTAKSSKIEKMNYEDSSEFKVPF